MKSTQKAQYYSPMSGLYLKGVAIEEHMHPRIFFLIFKSLGLYIE